MADGIIGRASWEDCEECQLATPDGCLYEDDRRTTDDGDFFICEDFESFAPKEDNDG